MWPKKKYYSSLRLTSMFELRNFSFIAGVDSSNPAGGLELVFGRGKFWIGLSSLLSHGRRLERNST
jgi:hypothetical protein